MERLNETYLILRSEKGYFVEAVIDDKHLTKEVDDVQQATEWIEELKGEEK